MNRFAFRSLLALSALACAAALPAQGPAPIPTPAGNPLTEAKIQLGKALFWDEQMSSTRTVSCGTCHQPARGGTDARSVRGLIAATHPGADGLFATPDDVTGSPGVPLSLADGSYVLDEDFGATPQVTGRKTPTMIDSAFVPELFWDGRAGGQLVDPLTGALLLNGGAALESQALGPPLSTAEMGHLGRDWRDVCDQLEAAQPLALAATVPPALQAWIAERSYPELFLEAFGSDAVTPGAVAMALASYQRSLISQVPFDRFLAGDAGALTRQERQGRGVFLRANCAGCHGGPRLTDDSFRYIGVRPARDDPGRAAVTGNPGDQGRMKTPTLRNVALRAPYFHTGQFATLREVVDFYDRGGDFDAPNKDPRIQPLGLTEGEKQALVAFLGRPLTDPRVAAEVAPFDRPTLYAESDRVPRLFGQASPGSGGFAPRAIALEPPQVDNPSFTLAVDRTLGGAFAVLLIDSAAAPAGIPVLGIESFLGLSPALRSMVATPTVGLGAGGGATSLSFDLRDMGGSDAIGTELFGQWVVLDPGAPFGPLAASEGIQVRIF